MLIVRRPDPLDNVSDISKAYNAVTPNGDGLNDVWDIRELMDGDQCKIQIMNRWGSPVFESEDFSGVWTAVDNGGNDLPDGTYYYILDCGGDIRMRNAVTIIRNQ
jgi:gliding motility-associated-like protein